MPTAWNEPELLEQARLLVSRLERLSADSVWAHRASGVRGAILRSLELLEEGGRINAADELARLQQNLDVGFRIVENAAKELLR